MNAKMRRCLAMTVGAVALGGILLAAGVPGAALLAVAPALLCVGMHLAMDHGDPHGDHLLKTAQGAAARQAERPSDRVRRGA